METNKKKEQKKWLTSKRLFAIHGWLGLNFGLLLTIVCFTGAVAALTHEIEWLTDKSLRIEPTDTILWQETYDALKKAYPYHSIGGFAMGEPNMLDSLAWGSYITAPDGNSMQLRVNPYTAEIVRYGTRMYLTDFIRQFHYNFFSSYGFYLVCFVSFPLLFSLVSGLLFFKGWWKSLFYIRFGKGYPAFWSSLHRFIGVWSMLFGIIISITGVWYLLERDVVPRDIAYSSAPKLSKSQLKHYGSSPQLLPVDEYIDAAKSVFPQLQPTGVYMPSSPDGAVTIQGRVGHFFTRDRANAVYLDPYSGEVIDIRKSKESTLLKWWVNAADSLHFGYFGGVFTKILWALFAFCLPVLILSGAYLSFRKSGLTGAGLQNKTSIQSVAFPLRTFVMITILFWIACCFVYGYNKRQTEPFTWIPLCHKTIGPWNVEIFCGHNMINKNKADVYLYFTKEGSSTANFKHAAFNLRSSNQNSIIQEDAQNSLHFLKATIPVADQEFNELWIDFEIEEWSGKIHQITIPFSVSDFTKENISGQDGSQQMGSSIIPNPPFVFYIIIILMWLCILITSIVWFWLDRKIVKNDSISKG